MKKILFTLLSLSMLFVGCKKPDTLILSLDIDDLKLGIEDTYQLHAVNNGELKITWESGDETIVTVTDDGFVTAVGVGAAPITVTAGNHIAGCVVTVSNVNSITLDVHKVLSWTGLAPITLTPTLYPEIAQDAIVTYTSSNPNIAVVTPAGIVYSVSPGVAMITAKAGIKIDSCEVNVMSFAFLENSSIWRKTNETVTLATELLGYAPADLHLEFTSEKSEVATVDQNALVTPVVAGITNIVATISSQTYDSEVTFKKEVLFYNAPVAENADGINFNMFKVDGNVEINDFFIAEYEVTQALWKKVMGATYVAEALDKGNGDNYPMYNVNWYDAVLFCNRLSDLTGKTPYYDIDSLTTDPNNSQTADTKKWTVTPNTTANGFRLPTEKEWILAAKGGNQTHNFEWSGGNLVVDVAWTTANAGGNTHEVGTKAMNEVGAYDMSGNVREWCFDWYGTTIGTATSGQRRVARGGAFSDVATTIKLDSRAQAQASGLPHQRTTAFGLRLVYSAQ